MKKYLYLLIIGLLLWSLEFIYPYIVSDADFDPNQNLMMHFRMFPVWVMLLYAVVIGPIFEELAFRLWAKGKMYATIISFALILIYVLAITQNFLIVLPVELVFAYLYFFYKGKYKMHLLAITTSIVFGCIHIDNYAGMPYKYIPILIVIGIGMILSFIALRFGVRYAILLHIVNNFFAFYFSTDGFKKMETELVITNENYTVNVQSVPLTEYLINKVTENNFLDSSIVYFGGDVQFALNYAKKYLNETDVQYYTDNGTVLINYEFTINASESLYGNRAIFDSIISFTKTTMDTFMAPEIILKLNDTTQYKAIDTTRFVIGKRIIEWDLYGMLPTISNQLKAPVSVPHDNYLIEIDKKILSAKSRDECIKYLQSSGFNITYDSTQMYKCIKFTTNTSVVNNN